MTLQDIANYFKFTRQQKVDLLLTLLLPLSSGVVILIAVNPSLATEAGVLNLCLLAVVAILPVWLTNIIIWSLLFVKLLRVVAKHAASMVRFPKPFEDRLMSIIDEFPMPSGMYGIYPISHVASVIVAVSAYMAAALAYLTNASLVVTYAILVLFCLLAGLCFRIIVPKIVGQMGRKEMYSLWEALVPGLDRQKRQEILNSIEELRQEACHHAEEIEKGTSEEKIKKASTAVERPSVNKSVESDVD